MAKRRSGILLHISSLPSAYGIGDFGPEAYAFIDAMREAKQTLWQILPLNPVNPALGASPYTSDSAFAINPLLISPERLVEQGLLRYEDLELAGEFEDGPVNFEAVVKCKVRLLNSAYESFRKSSEHRSAFEAFEQEQAHWLEDYATFRLIKKHHDDLSWDQWPKEFKFRDPAVIEDLRKDKPRDFENFKFIQYILYHQWMSLKSYAMMKGIHIVGDLPIYVNFDSADVWTNPTNFKMDREGRMEVVAGVPPDYFSKTGQRWGNPVYDWAAMTEDNFSWWIRRVQHNLNLFNIVRVDHFRAFVNYWEIPSAEATAINGKWAEAPTTAFFKTLKQEFGDVPFIAEDLGMIDDETRKKIDALGFPGMKILMFAFGGDMKTHAYLPHNYDANSVVYTGTHDNNTVQGWYEKEATEEEKTNFLEYFEGHSRHGLSDRSVHWDMIELALDSKASMALIPMQDILGLDHSNRMNVPGQVHDNWQWRLLPDQLTKAVLERLARYTRECRRAD
ncbi:MAG: 4-alpha-glucanotransferase [Candidatus Omnitrophica bacterium]|nr:4-alpha-glucanotransferase [Candidatus Omnitrophota bacterium]